MKDIRFLLSLTYNMLIKIITYSIDLIYRTITTGVIEVS